MRLTSQDSNASEYEVWLTPAREPFPAILVLNVMEEGQPDWLVDLLHDPERPHRVHACVMADEEAGEVEFFLLGRLYPEPRFVHTGIGFDAPLPRRDEIPRYDTVRLRGRVELRPRQR